MPPTLLSEQKKALRAALIRRRAEAHAADPEAGARLAALFPDHLTPRRGEIVAGYAPFRNEIDPGPLLARFAGLGAVLALPRTPRRAEEGITFRRYAPGDPLDRDDWGVAAPHPAAPIVRPDVMLAPLLGFDDACRRIGYGQGHYDRYLAAARPRLVIGLAYAAQRVEGLPVEPHDAPLDAVVTPDGVHYRV